MIAKGVISTGEPDPLNWKVQLHAILRLSNTTMCNVFDMVSLAGCFLHVEVYGYMYTEFFLYEFISWRYKGAFKHDKIKHIYYIEFVIYNC